MFFSKNQEIPFFVKLKVLNACFMSAILYSCESWINISLRPLETLYVGAVKLLLGVRLSTCNATCLVEVGLPLVQAMVKQKQEFFQKMLRERKQMLDDPFMFAWNFAKDNNTSAYKYLKRLHESSENYIVNSVQELKQQIEVSNKSKMVTYKDLNPTLEKPCLYTQDVPEHVRIKITRLRLSSHNLKIETGRWSRLPKEERLCSCGVIQTERHIIENCTLTERIRDKYSLNNVNTVSVLKCSTMTDIWFTGACPGFLKGGGSNISWFPKKKVIRF